jgi:hypothetical protein
LTGAVPGSGPGFVPSGAGLEVGVVELLDLQEGFGWLFAVGDAFEVAEVLEALHARGDDDEDVGVVARGGGEGVGQARRDDDEVAAFGGDDLVSGQELGGAVEQVEQFGGVGVVVWLGAVGPPVRVTRRVDRAVPVELASASRRMVVGFRR